MIPKQIELEILQELEVMGEHKSVGIYHNEYDDWGSLMSEVATSHAINSKLPNKIVKGITCFKVADLKELFKTSTISIVTFCDYSKKKI